MQYAVLLGILVTGFLGSWHCGLMCSPLSCHYKKLEHFASYHIGRLFSYIGLSSVAYLGVKYLLSTDSRSFKLFMSLFFGLLFFTFAMKQAGFIQTDKIDFKIFKKVMKIFGHLSPKLQKLPLVLGLLTGFLPCGWLYSFVFLASQAPSWELSVCIIGLFWLTSLPAFFVFRGFMSLLVRNSSFTQQKLSAVVLLVAGLMSIAGHWIEMPH